jgi:hypothetical protein
MMERSHQLASSDCILVDVVARKCSSPMSLQQSSQCDAQTQPKSPPKRCINFASRANACAGKHLSNICRIITRERRCSRSRCRCRRRRTCRTSLRPTNPAPDHTPHLRLQGSCRCWRRSQPTRDCGLRERDGRTAYDDKITARCETDRRLANCHGRGARCEGRASDDDGFGWQDRYGEVVGPCYCRGGHLNSFTRRRGKRGGGRASGGHRRRRGRSR